jgi:type III pantothenate kinase
MYNNTGTNLIIDIGNTLTKLALFSKDEVIAIEKHEKLSDSLLEKFINNHNVIGAIVSSVTNDIPDLKKLFTKKIPILNFDSTTPIPIKSYYKTPKTLGVDRLALAVAANSLYPNQNALAIDCGTAMTFDFVNSNNNYMGGAISPGINTRFRALHHFTSKLPLIKINETYPVIGDDTSSCILSGVLNGVINEVDGYIDMVKLSFPDLKVVFTGGESFFFDKKLKNSIFVHPNLLLFGLNRILKHNVEQ